MIICVTGKFGSGKTTVSKLLGFKAVNADYIGKKVFDKKKEEIKKLLGTLDKGKIRKKIFSDKRLLKRFNAIAHPEMIKIIKYEIRKNKGKNIVVDAALHYDLKLRDICDKIILVKRDKEKIIKTSKMSRKETEKIIRNQKVPAKADFVIVNNSSKEDLRKKTEEIKQELRKDF